MENLKPEQDTIEIYEKKVKVMKFRGVMYVDMSELPKITGWPKSSTDRFVNHHPATSGVRSRKRGLPGKTGKYISIEDAEVVRTLMSEAESFSYTPDEGVGESAKIENSER